MSDKNVTALDKSFDWGFSLLKVEEISDVMVAAKALEEANKRGESKVEQLLLTILPLLSSLASNPEKEYIHWPDRAKKIKELEERLSNIANNFL